MAITIPKLITDITPYFKYENESDATTQDQFQAYLKNEHNVLEVLVKDLWQASTAYAKGQMIHTVNMPEAYVAICSTAGTSGANEPTWIAGSTSITDGTAKWRMVLIEHNNMTGATTSAAGKAGLVPAPSAGDENKYFKGDGTFMDLPTATNSQKGIVSIGDNLTINSGVISLAANNIINALGYTPSTSSEVLSTQVSVTASQQSAISSTLTGGADDSTISATLPTVVSGLSAQTVSLQSILQSLVDLSHSHGSVTKKTSAFHDSDTCRYGNECSCSSCIIKGIVITNKGIKDIQDLKVGDMVLGIDNKYHKVIGIKLSKLGNRKAVSMMDIPSAIFTDDHLYLLRDGEYGTYDIKGYIRESSVPLTDGRVYGTYSRLEKKEIINLKESKDFIINYKGKYNLSTFIIEQEMPEDTITYTPIIENCEWIYVSDIQAACARGLNG